MVAQKKGLYLGLLLSLLGIGNVMQAADIAVISKTSHGLKAVASLIRIY